MATVADFAKTTLKLPSRIGIPIFGTNPNDPKNEALFNSEVHNIPAWTVAYGLCILGFSSDKDEKPVWSSVKSIKRKIADFFKQFLP